ncbi:hypothetical protein [Flavobacterium columnare]|uniref:Uncharacterized protein n=1 Tax=Flavobacterium columnare TaxID=996 RepID=A0AA94F0E4_9FLAO|nr:hypothetical protein [Flavobacterium columnare]MCH4830343.1 hypothetical protein [Flavobacterium columnare]MCH4833721.1 hypothetical protein [Flavobacterium columnare]
MDCSANDYALGARLKSKRRRKRLSKKAKEKQLIALHHLEMDLWHQKRNLPLVPLEKPYQKGWVRFFVVRDDVQRVDTLGFFTELLEKINNQLWSDNKRFTKRKRKFRRRIDVPIEQKLKRFSEIEWTHPNFKLTPKEKEYFEAVEEWDIHKKCYCTYYEFKEKWRFVLRVRPYMITHTKALDVELERELKQIKNYIERNHLRYLQNKLVYGRSFKWDLEVKDIQNPLKAKSIVQIYQEYLDESKENNYGK